jgi:cobalt-zinc-cadmium efflux system outer membrane protein
MIPLSAKGRLLREGVIACLGWLGLAGGVLPAFAEQGLILPESTPPVLSREIAVPWALEHNPDLATLRQQHGIAAAAVVLARTYPFNPVIDAKTRGVSGPVSAGITNRVSQEYKLLLEVELHGQGAQRRQAAAAALSRTDWEIAAQEQALGVRVVRAFDTVLYRQEKLRLIEETIRFDEEAAQQVRRLVEQGKLSRVDWIVSRSDAEDGRAPLSPARTALATARNDLRRALGMVNETFELHGSLETPAKQHDAASLTQEALQRRAELHARRLAVDEADARLRLEMANRHGNPTIGPDWEYSDTRTNHIGVQLGLPLPVFNRHRGEILQRQAEQARASLELRQTEVLIRQQVQAALDRLEEARKGVAVYRTRILPNLQSSLQELQRLYALAEPGADLPRVIDFRRRLLKAQDAYLDALLELRQAQADLAAAVGDPSLAMPPGSPGPKPGAAAPAGPPFGH